MNMVNFIGTMGTKLALQHTEGKHGTNIKILQALEDHFNSGYGDR